MPHITNDGPQPRSWRGRYDALAHPPRRGGLASAAAAVLVAAQLVLAPLTLALAGAFLLTGRLARWRRGWLAWPAVVGGAWMLTIGTRPALAGYLGWAAHLITHASAAGPLGSLIGRSGLLAGWRADLPGQAPLALTAGAAEAAIVDWLRDRSAAWPRRRGQAAAVRGAYLRWVLRRGELATGDGGCVGVVTGTGKRATVAWREAAEGVLCTGRDTSAMTAAGLDLVLAAIAHRKAVVIVDLTPGGPGPSLGAGRTRKPRGAAPGRHESRGAAPGGAALRDGAGLGGGVPGGAAPRGGAGLAGGAPGGPIPRAGLGPAAAGWVAQEIQLACAAAGAPLVRFAAPGGCYEPFAVTDAGPAQAAALTAAMIDWGGLSQGDRRYATDYLDAACTVIAAFQRPARDLSSAVIDELIGLLAPGQLASRLADVPGYVPGRGVLAARITELSTRAVAGQAVIGQLREQLAGLRASDAGRWLEPREGQGISVPLALEARQVLWFGLDVGLGGAAARMITRLVVADLTWTLAERARLAAPADCVVWINGCDREDLGDLARLSAAGRACGTAVLVGATGAAAVQRIAAGVNVVLVRGPGPLSSGVAPGDPAAARWDLPAASEAPGGAQALPAEPPDDRLRAALAGARQPDEVALLVRAPRPRSQHALAAR